MAHKIGLNCRKYGLWARSFFKDVASYEDFKQAVPVRDYEDLKGYIQQIIDGQENILWPGKPIYFAKTSGTTSGTKYIPISKDSISNHINSARDALLNYIHETGKGAFLDNKLIFLSGSPVLDTKGNVPTGRLSGISNHHVPAYLRTNQLPSYETNCIEEWEEKLERIIDETISQPMSLISGIPRGYRCTLIASLPELGNPSKMFFPNFNSSFMEGSILNLIGLSYMSRSEKNRLY